MSKITGWTKHKGFISIEVASNCLSKWCQVTNRPFQGSIRQSLSCMCEMQPFLISVPGCCKLEAPSEPGDIFSHSSFPTFHLQWCHSKLVSAGSSTFDFFLVAHLWFYFSLICWSEEMPDWHPQGLQFPVGTCANESRKQELCACWISWRF